MYTYFVGYIEDRADGCLDYKPVFGNHVLELNRPIKTEVDIRNAQKKIAWDIYQERDRDIIIISIAKL